MNLPDVGLPNRGIKVTSNTIVVADKDADMPVHFRDGSGWEQHAGYSRAIRRGPHIEVSGTTASAPDGGTLSPGDTGGQTRAALERAFSAVRQLGGRRPAQQRCRA